MQNNTQYALNFKPKQYSSEEVFAKLMKFCAYQERSSFEVKGKAYQLGLSKDKIEEMIDKLIDERFIDDERFAMAFVQGKLNIKRWGKYKITEGLYAKGISGDLAQAALASIQEDSNLENLDYWIKYKMEREVYTKTESPKLYRFLLSKGFESDLIVRALKKLKLM